MNFHFQRRSRDKISELSRKAKKWNASKAEPSAIQTPVKRIEKAFLVHIQFWVGRGELLL